MLPAEAPVACYGLLLESGDPTLESFVLTPVWPPLGHGLWRGELVDVGPHGSRALCCTGDFHSPQTPT